jgi:sugar phosphate permease
MKHIHRGWLILCVATINILACLGFGRFSFGAIVPFMKEGLSLSYTETGLIASSVFLGYLIAALSCGFFVMRYTARRVILISLSITALGMLGSALSFNFWSAYLSCFIIGIGAGGGNVTTLGLVGRWFTTAKRGMALGISNSGSGLGMVLSGFIVPIIIVLNPTEGWRISWFLLTGAVIVIILINYFLLRNHPEEIGVKPIGDELKSSTGAPMDWEDHPFRSEIVYKNRILWALGLIYFTWGFSYLIFSTFFVDYLINDRYFDKEQAGQYFAIAGICSILSGVIWGVISDRIGRLPALFTILFIQGMMLLALNTFDHPSLLLGMTIIYASTLWGVPAVIVTAVSDFMIPSKSPSAIGFITLFFGIGQFISPVITGYLVESASSYFHAFNLSAGVVLLGSLGCIGLFLIQKKKAIAISSAKVLKS